MDPARNPMPHGATPSGKPRLTPYLARCRRCGALPGSFCREQGQPLPDGLVHGARLLGDTAPPPLRWTRRARTAGAVALLVSAFLLGACAPLWDAMPWAVTP